jgi:hypothetical protein
LFKSHLLLLKLVIFHPWWLKLLQKFSCIREALSTKPWYFWLSDNKRLHSWSAFILRTQGWLQITRTLWQSFPGTSVILKVSFLFPLSSFIWEILWFKIWWLEHWL